MQPKEIVAGVDLGGTNIKLGLFDANLACLCKDSVPMPPGAEPVAVIDMVFETACRLLCKNNLTEESLLGVGIGAPGPADLSKGIIIASPNIPSFKNVPLAGMLSERFGKPAVLENDANAACWGEFVAGAGKDVTDMIFFTLGTGIGGAVIIDGRLVHGSDDAAGELGHMIIYPGGRTCGCGQRGCVEAYASASSTARRAGEALEAGRQSSLSEVLKQTGDITCKDVFDHAAAGDALASGITDGTAEALAIVCVNMLHVTDPRRIVFAGGMIAAGDALLEKIRHYFNKHVWKMKTESIRICFATLGEDAGITGTAALARDAAGIGGCPPSVSLQDST